MIPKSFLLASIAGTYVLPINAVPDCGGGVHKGHVIKDIPYTGHFQDGQGTYITSDNFSHPYVFPLIRKCWWDYYTVEGEVFYTSWQQADGEL